MLALLATAPVGGSARWPKRGASRAVFEKTGYIILEGVLSDAEVDAMAARVDAYPISKMVGSRSNGFIAMNVRQQHPELAMLFHRVHGQARLQALLSELYDDSYRFLERNEVLVQGLKSWHKDQIPFPQWKVGLGDEWTSFQAPAQRYGLCVVVVYLQSHLDNDDALALVPRSHLTPTLTSASALGERVKILRPGKGAVVVFDWRLEHRSSANDTIAKLSLLAGKQRRLLSLSYGRDNLFSRRIASGISLRDAVYNNASWFSRKGCNVNVESLASSPCLRDVVLREMKVNSTLAATEFCSRGKGQMACLMHWRLKYGDCRQGVGARCSFI